MILSQQLLLNSSRNFTRPAFRYLGKETFYKDLMSSISRLSYLHQHELPNQLRVAYLCRNSPAFITTFFAMTNLRAVSIPINPDLPPEEIEKWIRESRANHLAVTSDLLGFARELNQSYRLGLPMIEIEKKKGGEYDTSYSPPPDQVPIETDPILLLRSSGYSHKPQLVTLTHRQLLHSAQALKGLYHVSPADRFFTPMSWSHPFAFLHGMLFPLLSGACCIIDHGQQNAELLPFIAESRVTRLVGSPHFFQKLVSISRTDQKKLPVVKSVVVGAGPLSQDVRQAFNEAQIAVSQVYGQVENVWTIAMNDALEPGDAPENRVREFVGKGLPGIKYKVMNSNGDEIPGKGARTGLLAVSGPTVMHSYYGKEKETKMALRGTWLYTGDVARLEGEGETLTICLIGRKEDQFELNGEIVPFEKINQVIRENTMVEDGASFFIKNSRDEPMLVCALVKQAGAQINEMIFTEYCKTKLPAHLVPKAVVFTDQIPRDFGSNIHYHRLRGQFSGLTG